MLELIGKELPILLLRTVERPPLVRDWQKRHVWSADRNGLSPWAPWREPVQCKLWFAAVQFGWKMPDPPKIPDEATAFFNTLRAFNEQPAIDPSWSGLLGTEFYFDVSSYRNKAFYRLSTNQVSKPAQIRTIEYELTFGVTVFCEDIDVRVIANVRQIDWALCVTAKICRVPILT